MIKSFDMRESHLDGDQDLTMFIQEVEDVVLEIMEDTCFKGHQHYRFQEWLDDDDGQRVFGRAFQIGQFRYV